MTNGSPAAEPPPVEWFVGGTIAARKLDGYLLSLTHPKGQHKARLWGSVFGFGQGDAAILEEAIREQLHQAKPVEKSSVMVRRWELIIPHFLGPNGTVAPVLTAWALEPGKCSPHLTTAYPIVGY